MGSPCPLNVGVQDLVTKPRETTLRGKRGAREGKKQRLVKVSQLFLSETVACPLSIYPFSQEQSFTETICLLLSLTNTANLHTFKAYVSCLNHLSVY